MSGFIGGGLLRPNSIATHRGIATPVPTLGAELLLNPGFETWASATDAANWSESLNGTTTINRENAVQHSGSYCARTDVDGSSSNAELVQSVTGLTVGDWFLISYWMRASVAGKTARFYIPNLVGGGPPVLNPVPTDWTQYFVVDRTTNVKLDYYCRVNSAANASIYFDDLSAKRVTLASTFSGRTMADSNQDVSAPVTVYAPRLRGGVVARLDSLTSPANFLIASHDGITARLTQCLAGVYTELKTGTPTYVAGAPVRIWVSGNTAKLFYNGTQVSTDAIVDVGLTGTIFGKWNTHPSNVIGACTIVAAS